ncbi:MAG: DUF4160 domain-containing protein [Gammaproteobacteria bacterium]
MHVLSADGEAKFWLEPEIKLARNHGYSRSQLKLVESMVGEHYDELIAAWLWRRYFAG